MRSDAESVDSDVEPSQEDAVAIDVQSEEGLLVPPADRESGDVVRAVARFEAGAFVEAELGRTTTSKTFATAHHDEAEPPWQEWASTTAARKK